MILLGLVPFAASLLLAFTSRGLARFLSPPAAAFLLTLLALATSMATGIVLCLAAFSELARLPFVAAVGGWSRTTIRPWDHLPRGWGDVATAVVAVLLAAAVLYLGRAARDLLLARQACRALPADTGGLVITHDDRPTAYTVPARTGAIVISTGMLRLLSAGERRALLAHEAAHLRHHHARYVLLAQLAAAANPLLRPLARDVSLAVELWADQAAVAEVGDRHVVAQALARSSLAAARQERRPIISLAIADTAVQVRVRALTGRPPRLRAWAALAALTLTVASGAAAAALTLATHQQIEQAQLASARATAAHPGPVRIAAAHPGPGHVVFTHPAAARA
ncbi:MAG: M56 family metallopeptidase [Actinomycetota bacterium]